MEKQRLEAVPIEGLEQIGRVNTPLQPFIIKVVDENGEPVPFVPVDFRRTDDGQGMFDYADVETQQDGTAAAEYTSTEGGKFRIECYVGMDRAIAVPFTGMVDDGEGNMSKVRPSGRPRVSAHPRRDAPELNPAILAPDDPVRQAKFTYPPRGVDYASQPPVIIPPPSPVPPPAAAKAPVAKTEPMPTVPEPVPAAVERAFFAPRHAEPEIEQPRRPARRRNDAHAVLNASIAALAVALVVMGCMIAFGSKPASVDTTVSEPAPSAVATSGVAANP